MPGQHFLDLGFSKVLVDGRKRVDGRHNEPLRNLKVLRAPASPGTASKLGGSFDTKYQIVLAVTDNQSQKLLFATHNSDESASGGEPGWWLELRPNLNPSDSPGSIETLTTMLRDGLSPRQARLLFGSLGGS